mmetsp:Transcript_3241/g.7402  ORF Transcript_3241/g.7402 Transcript_3241/m.7402 type:complete len:559 (-) Transcript_3241:717-2393(-)
MVQRIRTPTGPFGLMVLRRRGGDVAGAVKCVHRLGSFSPARRHGGNVFTRQPRLIILVGEASSSGRAGRGEIRLGLPLGSLLITRRHAGTPPRGGKWWDGRPSRCLHRCLGGCAAAVSILLVALGSFVESGAALRGSTGTSGLGTGCTLLNLLLALDTRPLGTGQRRVVVAVGSYLDVLAVRTRSVAMEVGRRRGVLRGRPRGTLAGTVGVPSLVLLRIVAAGTGTGTDRIRTPRGVEELARVAAAVILTGLHPERHVGHRVGRRRWGVVVLGVRLVAVGWVAIIVGPGGPNDGTGQGARLGLVGEAAASAVKFLLDLLDACPLLLADLVVALLLDWGGGRSLALLPVLVAGVLDAAGGISVGGGGATSAAIATGLGLGLLAVMRLGLGDLGHLRQEEGVVVLAVPLGCRATRIGTVIVVVVVAGLSGQSEPPADASVGLVRPRPEVGPWRGRAEGADATAARPAEPGGEGSPAGSHGDDARRGTATATVTTVGCSAAAVAAVTVAAVVGGGGGSSSRGSGVLRVVLVVVLGRSSVPRGVPLVLPVVVGEGPERGTAV